MKIISAAKDGTAFRTHALEELRSSLMAKVVDPNLGQLELSGVGLC